MGKDGGKETKGASGEGGGSKSVVKQHRDKQMNLGWGRGGGGVRGRELCLFSAAYAAEAARHMARMK